MDIDFQLQQQLSNSYCNCHNVSYKEINSLVCNLKNIKSIEGLRRYITVGKECNKCEANIIKIINFYKK